MTEGGADAVRISGVRRRLGRSGDETVEFHLDEFRAAAGSRLALTGPSGCGKSTLLNLICGLVEPDAGTIEVAGTDVTKLGRLRRDRFRGRTVGFVYQSFNLLDPFTAQENVEIGMKFSGLHGRERHDRARALLDRVGLSKRLHSRPGKLSVGERQRVAIARALAARPAVLLADEPTGALDPTTAESVFDLLLEVAAEEGSTLLLVTHDHDLAERLPEQYDCRHLIARGGAGA